MSAGVGLEKRSEESPVASRPPPARRPPPVATLLLLGCRRVGLGLLSVRGTPLSEQRAAIGCREEEGGWLVPGGRLQGAGD